MKMPTIKPKTTSIPARSVPSAAGVTPLASSTISRAKQFGKNPDATPVVKMGSLDGLGSYYQKTIEDIDKMDRHNIAKNTALILGLGSVGAAGAAGFQGNKSLKNAFIGLAGISGLLSGMHHKKKRNLEYRMRQRHKGIASGFQKRAVLGGLGHALIESGKAVVQGGGVPIGPLAVTGVDILTLPYAGKKGTELLRKGVSRGLKERLGLPMSGGERMMEGVSKGVSGARETWRSGIKKIVKTFGGGDKAQNVASGIADYPGQVVGALTGEGGGQIASVLEPAFNVAHQVDPLMTQRIVHAIPAGKEGDKARKAIKNIGKVYEKSLKKVERAFNETDVLNKMISSKPGGKEKFMADLKGVYDSRLHHTKIEDSADQVIKIIKDFDRAAGKAKDYHSKNEKLFNVLGTILRKGSPAKPLKETISGQKAEEFVDRLIKGIEASKAGARGFGFAATGLGGGYIAGYGGEKAHDKLKSSKIREQEILRKVS